MLLNINIFIPRSEGIYTDHTMEFERNRDLEIGYEAKGVFCGVCVGMGQEV